MNKLNKLLATVILGHLFSAYATAPERESADCPLQVAANPPEGELVRVPPGTPEAVTVRDSKLDPIQLPAQSMSELLLYRSLPSKRSYLKEVRDFLNDKTQQITLIIPQGLVCIQDQDFLHVVGGDLRSAIAVVDLSHCCRLQSIGSWAFACSNLEEILFPSCLEVIKKCAFDRCSNLRKVDLRDCCHLQSIGKCAFAYSSLEEILFPSCLEVIKKCAFSDCTKLRIIDLRACCRLWSIGEYAFANSSLEEILFPPRISGYIGADAFGGCIRLRKAILPIVGEDIGVGVFLNCSSLRHLILGDMRWNGEVFASFPWFFNKNTPSLSEVKFIGMGTSKLPPDFGKAIVRRDWLIEEFPNEMPALLYYWRRDLDARLSPDELMEWKFASLSPKFQEFVGSPEYRALDETVAREAVVNF